MGCIPGRWPLNLRYPDQTSGGNHWAPAVLASLRVLLYLRQDQDRLDRYQAKSTGCFRLAR